jgi:hypothetical protein
MESVSHPKRGKILVGTVLGLLFVSALGASYYFDLWPWHRGLSSRLDVPVTAQLEMKVRLLNTERKPFLGGSSMGWPAMPEADMPEKVKPPRYQDCPLWFAGDGGFSRVFPEDVPDDVRQSDPKWQETYNPMRPACLASRNVTWTLVRNPVAATLNLHNARSIWKWLARKDTQDALTPFQNLLTPIKEVLALPFDQFTKQGIKAQLAQEVIEDLLSQDARLHFDRWRGRQGYILSFSSKAPSLGREAVYTYLQQRVERQYKVGSLSIYEAPLLQNRLFAIEREGRTYLGFDLSALLNLLDSAEDQEVLPSLSEAGLSVRMRPGAWLGQLQDLLFEKSEQHVDLIMQLNPKQTLDLSLNLSQAGPFSAFMKNQNGNIWKSIPADIFFALGSRVSAPSAWQPTLWGERLSKGESPWVEAEGKLIDLGFIWDFEVQDDNPGNVTEVFGFVLRRDDPKQDWPAPSIVKMDGVTCEGGRTLLLATSLRLRQRMFEACEGRSISWAEQKKQSPQQRLALYLAPGQLAPRLLSLGGAYEALAKIRAEPKKIPGMLEAHEAALRKTEDEWSKIPAFLFIAGEDPKHLKLSGSMLGVVL